MGILNVTPDSFSDGGSYASVAEAVDAAMRMVDEGAMIIDVGGESTRPGATEVAIEEEQRRVVDVVRALAERGVCVSIDTRHADVARAAVDAGACIINDVSGFSDPRMCEVARACDAGLIVMHGYALHAAGELMDSSSCDIVSEIARFLRERCEQLEALGIDKSRLCIDPGPGFGKSEAQSREVVRNFQEFRRVGYPVCCAISRKRFIGKAYGIDNPQERDEASAKEARMAAELGASILRVHNVACTKKALEDLRPYCIVALGCNVALVGEDGEETQGKIALLNMAISDMCQLPDTLLVDVSGFYESEPAYYEDQDSFINAVALLRTGIAPHELLDYLHAIENKLGRVRTIANGPRTCDLDILDYQLYISNDEKLILPHPRICERDFVVKPLSEMLPRHILSDGTPVESVPEEERIGHAVFVSRS